MNQRVMVVVPTYNEADNIEELVKKLREKGVELIIVDDFSPDGTWKIVDNLGKEDTGVHLIVRKGKKSFGFAIREGLIKALDMGADVIVEMDADFSHSIEDLSKLLNSLEQFDVVVGSRLVEGGEDFERSFFRRLMTKLSCAYARFLLGLRVKDVNSGYRAFKREAMQRIDPRRLKSDSYAVLHEILFYAAKEQLKVGEVPIKFLKRKKGRSNVNAMTFLKSAITDLKLSILGRA